MLDDEVFDQAGNVLHSLRKGGQLDREHLDPVVESSRSLPSRTLSRGSRGGGNDADVEVITRLPPARFDGVFLQHAQQFGLQGPWAFQSLVEEDRCRRRQFELADACLDRAGEGAFLIAKQLAFQDLGRDRRRN